MQDVARIKVPLLVDAGHGKNWALAHWSSCIYYYG